MKKIARIRSGGQTGVDRAALDAARELNVPICGWCPKGGWAEDYDMPPGLLIHYPELRETTLSQVDQRTHWNVRDSHASLIVVGGSSGGTNLTLQQAKLLRRPFLTVCTTVKVEQIVKWLDCIDEREITLNIAGPRESEHPGIYKITKVIVKDLLKKSYWNNRE